MFERLFLAACLLAIFILLFIVLVFVFTGELPELESIFGGLE